MIKKIDQLISHYFELRRRFQNDPLRPKYHFVPPSSWMNDITGSIFWKGRYHIFYQHNPDGAYWKWMQWGHASSIDLVHWVHHPIALTPSQEGPDRDGCYSGGAFVNKEGLPTFIYHGVPGGTCIATSDDDMLTRWTKFPSNPVIRTTSPGEPGHEQYKVFDPCAWLDGDTYYSLIGNRIPGLAGDATSLFKSTDLVKWNHVGPFYRSDRRWTEADEDCAVPDFFQLGDKHMLLFCSHLQGTQYYIGKLEEERLHPEIHGRMSWPSGLLGGPRTLQDGNGRRILFDWIREVRDQNSERASGWSGVMTVPRILSLAEDCTLRIEPIPELATLRMNPRVHRDMQLTCDSELVLDDIQGDCLEMMVSMNPHSAHEFGVKVRCSEDGEEQTSISFNASSEQLMVDVSRSTLDRSIQYHHYRNPQALERLPEEARTLAVQKAPFTLAGGETLKLHIFLDRSVLEVFANSRQCVTHRIYPIRLDSLGVRLFSRGGNLHVQSVEAWDMAPAHD